MAYAIRTLNEADNAEIERVIRSCLVEFGADHEGTAWADPVLTRLSEAYACDGCRYWVAEDDDGRIVAGVGIGRLEGAEGTCELQKMYCLPEHRGTGVAGKLLDAALEYAAGRYKRCYLETLGNMVAAQRFYEKHGFERTDEAAAQTGHFACDVRYIRQL